MEDITNKKKWWQSSNFWTAVVLVIGGFFVGFPEVAGTEAVAGVFALIAVGKTLHNYFKTAAFDWRSWLDDANFWNYLATVVVAVFPTLPSGAIENLETAVRSAIGGNWQGLIIALFSLGTILYKTLKPQPGDPGTA
jgi:hypothetical protein